jgi:hypothetical protein
VEQLMSLSSTLCRRKSASICLSGKKKFLSGG